MVILIQRDARKTRENTEGESRDRLADAPRHCRVCRDLVGKTKAQLELNLAKGLRDKSSSIKYILQ